MLAIFTSKYLLNGYITRTLFCCQAKESISTSHLFSTTNKVIAPVHSVSFYDNRLIDEYLKEQPTYVSLKQLYDFGKDMDETKLLISGNFVKRQLAVRIAHRINDFRQLPFIVCRNPYVEKVYNLYWDAFLFFRNIPTLESLEENRLFVDSLRKQMKEHLVVIPMIAMGMKQSMAHLPWSDMDTFMDTLFRSRIGRRMLAEQHIFLSDHLGKIDKLSPRPSSHLPSQIGLVSTDCDAGLIAATCADVAADTCQATYGVTPQVILNGHVSDTLLNYIPDHIRYILFELLKNAMRAVVEHHIPSEVLSTIKKPLPAYTREGIFTLPVCEIRKYAENAIDASQRVLNKYQLKLPPIQVTICKGESDVVFRISDEGGGMDQITMQNSWHYCFTTANAFKDSFNEGMPLMAGKVNETTPMFGLGIGLPLSRVYASVFGGNVELSTMHGYGTDAYIRINRLGATCETPIHDDQHL